MSSDYSKYHAEIDALHRSAAPREFGLGIAQGARSRFLSTQLHHEESYTSHELRGRYDRQRLVTYAAKHKEEIRTAFRSVLESPEFTRERPAVAHLVTGVGDHPLNMGEAVMGRIVEAADSMQRASVVADDGEILFEQLPIRVYCIKAEEPESKRGTFTAYIATLDQLDLERDAVSVVRHPDLTVTGLLNALEAATATRLSDGTPSTFIWKQASFEILPSTAHLARREMESPGLERVRRASTFSGRDIVRQLLASDDIREGSVREVVEIDYPGAGSSAP